MALVPPVATQTDAELVLTALKDPQAIGAIIERYEEKLRRYIYRLGVRDRDEQADVLQDIFIKVYRNLNSYDHQLPFSSWIYRIAHNEAISWYRKRSVRPEGNLVLEGDDVLALLPTALEAPDVAFDRTIEARAVAEALKKLDERYREVLILRFFEHKEYDEISDILEIPIGSVGTLIHRGKKQLYHELNRNQVRI